MKKILSTTLVRVLALICGLFGCTLTGYAYYDEAIVANQDFYIYNVANGKYLQNNNGDLIFVSDLSVASVWKFSGESGKISVKNGSYYLNITPPVGISVFGFILTAPDETVLGTVDLKQSSTTIQLAGDINGYTMHNQGAYGLIGSTKRNYYFSNTIKARYTTNPTSAEKWKLISKRQVDNTISLPSSLSLDAIKGGDPAETQFDINHNGAPTSITITNGTTSLIMHSPEQPAQIKVAFTVADDGSKTIVISDVDDPSNKATYLFDSSTPASLTLTVSTTAESGNAIDADKKSILITGNVVELEPQTIDWTQDFTSLTPTTAPITLNAIAKDKSGNPTGRPIVYTLASSGVVKIVDGNLYVLAEGATSIKATVARDATYVGAEKTLAIKVSGVATDEITKTNADATGLFTGTVGGPSESYLFHKGITPIDLTRCFNEGGTALFDTLYIFGITSNTDGELVTYTGTDEVEYTSVPLINTPSPSVGCNATTPCYVYKKINETTYKYDKTFDATKTRFDMESKPDEPKHLYFTGYCPFAYMGVTPTAEGWMYFKGGNTTVDIYLDNCEIMGRYKTQSGMHSGYEDFTVIIHATKLGREEPNISFMSGNSSPFVFTSTTKKSDESYKPTIHIAGTNHLQGQLGSYIKKIIGKAKIAGMIEGEFDSGYDPTYTYSSPITIKPNDIGEKTDLVMTDIWKDNTVTNGYLKLDANKGTYSSEKVVAIDLGSANGSLTINGGQYHLRNSAADGTYLCNLAVGYRVFSKLYEVPIAKALLHLYGFGGDMADSKVTINSGTFTMYKNMYPNGVDAKGDTTYLGEGYYKDQETFLDLRLPAGKGESKINGGTFNGISNVLMCSKVTTTGASPENARGNWLCLHDVEITSEDNGVVTDFALSDPFDAVYTIDPCYNLTTTNSITGGRQYGAQSLNFYEKDIDGDSEKEKVVSLLLYPGKDCEDGSCCPDCEYQKEAIIFQWATAIPKFDATKTIEGQSQTVSIGGDIQVQETPSGEDIEYQTNQLLYLDCAGMENYSMNLVDQGAKLGFNEPNQPRGQVINENDYEIKKHLNILKSVQADMWYAFNAPFNVHDISVVETSDEATIATKKREQALDLQAQANLKIFYGLENFIIPTNEGRASSLTLDRLLGMSGIRSKKIQLKHYNGTTAEDNNYGTNLYNANYYLYELENEEFTTDGTGEELDIKWKPVRRNPGEPLMSQGKTYAIQFPWCPMCDDLGTRDYYDYWSNKLILFHGNGPQTVLGTAGQSSLSTAPDAGFATLAGNSTLADMTLTAQTAYVHNTATDIFELNNAQYVVKPTEGFLLYNPGAMPMPARISRTGQIEYDENAETGVDGVPTVGDRTSLMLFGAYDGFEVLALHEQLVTVYNLQGNIIFQQYMTAGEQVYMATGAGIYVVRGESEAIKVMIE